MIDRIKRKMQKMKKNSNKGFTLVELLVAVAILAMFVFPTLQIFVTSTKINTKSRIELQSTLTANSLAESAKAYSIKAFGSQCTGASAFTLLAGFTGNVYAVELDADGKICKIGSQTAGGTITDPDLKTFAYLFTGIKQSNSYYDALVIFTYDKEATQNSVNLNTGDYSASSIANAATESGGLYLIQYNIDIFVFQHSNGGGATLSFKNFDAKITPSGEKIPYMGLDVRDSVLSGGQVVKYSLRDVGQVCKMSTSKLDASYKYDEVK